MPFVAIISKVLLLISSFLIARVVGALGLGVMVFTGYSYVLDKIEQWVVDGYNSLPASAVQLLNISGVDFGIGIIFTAYTFRVALNITNRVVFGAKE